MKITIYKLIELVKDDKAPNKVKYKNKIYYYHKGYDFNYIYNSSDGPLLHKENSLFTFSSYKLKDGNQCWDDNSTIDFLNSEVEILTENKIPSKLCYFNLTTDENEKDECNNKLELHYTGVANAFDDVYEKINEIIDCLNKGDE